MNNNYNKAVIFDLDGTLMNTKAGILKSLDETVAKRGYRPIPEAKKITFVGPPMAKSLKKEYGFSDEECFAAAQEFRDLYAGDNSLIARTYPHMKAILEKLLREGYALGVATYKREDVALKILDHFGLSKYFRSIHGSDFDGKLSKAEIVELTMSELEADNTTAVVIGDTTGDGKAANEVGCAFIAVTYGYGFKPGEDLRELAPAGVAKTTDELYLKIHELLKIH